VGQAFAGGARAPPGMNEGVNIARTVANELDSARFDPLLVKSVAKNAVASLDMMLSRMDGLVCSRSAYPLVVVPDRIRIDCERPVSGDAHGSFGYTPASV